MAVAAWLAAEVSGLLWVPSRRGFALRATVEASPSGSAVTGKGPAWFEAAVAASSEAGEAVGASRALGRAILAKHPELVPNARAEAWRFTDLSGLFWSRDVEGSAGDRPTGDEWWVPAWGDSVCVVVDGVVDPRLSRNLGARDDVFVGSIADAPEEFASQLSAAPIEVELETANARGALGSAPWAALNAACLSDAAVVSIRGDARASVHFVHVSTEPRLAHPRLIVQAKDRAHLELHQTFASLVDGTFVNSRTTLDIDDDAKLDHVYAAVHEGDATHVEACTAAVRGVYASVAVSVGGAGRFGFDVELARSEATANLACLVLAGGSDRVDLRTQLRHEVPRAISNQDARLVVADQASAVFKGRIRVPQQAQQTDATQLCRSALLSDDATCTVMPSLEIIADDVKCAHGATVADLDGDALFFLQSRGLPTDAARALLVTGFCDSLLEALPDSTNPKLRHKIKAYIADLVKLQR